MAKAKEILKGAGNGSVNDKPVRSQDGKVTMPGGKRTA